MSAPDTDDGALLSLFRLVDDMQTELEADVQRFPVLVEHARSVMARGGGGGNLAADLKMELLGQLDGQAHDLERRQRHVLRLVDEAISSRKAAVQEGAGTGDVWAPAWQPPDMATAGNSPVPIRLPVSLQHRRQQLVRVLTIAGVLLVACGVLLGVL
jgi:hypothetical protein